MIRATSLGRRPGRRAWIATLVVTGSFVLMGFLFQRALQGWPLWAFYGMVAVPITAAAWYLKVERFWAGLPALVVLATVLVASPFVTKRERKWGAIAAGGLLVGGSMFSMARSRRRVVREVKRGIFTDVIEETSSLGDYVRRWAPLNAEGWGEQVEGTPAGKELRSLVMSRQWHKVETCVMNHAALRAIVERELDLEKRNALRVLAFTRGRRAPEAKSAEWKELYDRLLALLSGKGRVGSGGDFYLVDDEYGETAHKVEVLNFDLLTPELVREMQGLLQGLKNEWAVLVQPCFKDPPLKWHRGGLTVYADRVEEDWDRDLLRKHLRKRFRF